jgi:hypothetical protein
MATLRFTVGYNSKPTLYLPALLDGNGDAINITGYSFKLIVKPFLSNEDGKLPDSRAWFDKAGAIIVAADGTYKFVLTDLETTQAPGIYPGEIRIWSGSTSLPPDYRISVEFEIEEAVNQA